MPQTLKLSQALKRVRGGRKPGTLAKRMKAAVEEIVTYAAKPSNEKSVFGSEEEQRKQVAARQQAVKDLVMQALKTHAALDMKNLTTEVTTSMGKFSIADLVRLKRTYLSTWLSAYTDPKKAVDNGRLEVRGLMSGGNPVTVDIMFDEQERNEMVQKLHSFSNEIDELLDAINNDANVTIEIPD